MANAPLISIVDDDDSLRSSLGNLLRSVGLRVQECAGADAFLDSLEARETACLILDVRMPGMNGLDLQRHIAATDYQIPVIFITAHGDEEARRRALTGGAVDYLLKPFSEEALLNAIDAALSKKDGKK